MCASPPARLPPCLAACPHAPASLAHGLTPLPPWFALCRPQLANVLNNEQLFYTCIFPFIAFFGAFAFVLYPLKDQLHPTGERGRIQQPAAQLGEHGIMVP